MPGYGPIKLGYSEKDSGPSFLAAGYVRPGVRCSLPRPQRERTPSAPEVAYLPHLLIRDVNDERVVPKLGAVMMMAISMMLARCTDSFPAPRRQGPLPPSMPWPRAGRATHLYRRRRGQPRLSELADRTGLTRAMSLETDALRGSTPPPRASCSRTSPSSWDDESREVDPCPRESGVLALVLAVLWCHDCGWKRKATGEGDSGLVCTAGTERGHHPAVVLARLTRCPADCLRIRRSSVAISDLTDLHRLYLVTKSPDQVETYVEVHLRHGAKVTSSGNGGSPPVYEGGRRGLTANFRQERVLRLARLLHRPGWHRKRAANRLADGLGPEPASQRGHPHRARQLEVTGCFLRPRS